MKFEDLKKLYLDKKKVFGTETYKQISGLLKEAKKVHKRDKKLSLFYDSGRLWSVS